MPGAVLRHRVDPPVHPAIDGLDGDAEDRGQVLRRPLQQILVTGAAGQMSSPNRPNDSRTSSTLPRRPHLRDDNVIALARNRSPLATSTPECSGSGVPPGSARATNAVDATSIRRAAAAVRGATSSISAGSRGAGTASTTASACQRAPSSSTSSQPRAERLDPLDGHLRPPDAGSPDELVQQHRVSPVDSAEHRPGDGRRQRLAHRIGEVGRAAVQRRGQRRDGRAQADGGGGSGIDAGQQRVDGTCHHLLAEPVADQIGHRRIGAAAPGQKAGCVRRPCARSSRRPPARPATMRGPGCR